jgi:hypothetical protein
MEDQRVLHWFISEAFKFDKVENEEVNKGTETLLPSDSHSEEESVDPAQVDLEDSIAEIEAENAADAEMQEMKTEQIIEEREEEDNTPIVKAKDTKPFPTEDDAPVYDEDQIAERIREDEAAVAEVCDEQEVTYEEAQEYVAAQMAVDKLDAEEEGKRFVSDENIDATVKSEDADFSLEFSVDDEDDDDVQSGDMDFGFA